MTAIANMSALIALVTDTSTSNNQRLGFLKTGLIAGGAPTAPVAGSFVSLWQWDGFPSGASTTAPSTTSAVTTGSTSGALPIKVPNTGQDLFLCSAHAVSDQPGSLIIYDRLIQQGGLSGTVTTAQAVSTPSLTRYSTGLGVEMFCEIYTAVGTTATTITASYTNTVPSSGQTSQARAFGGTASNGNTNAKGFLPMPLAVGDNGVTAVSTVTVLASTLTAGSFGITLGYPLVVLPLPNIGTGFFWSGISSSGGPIDMGTAVNACLAFVWVPNGTTAPKGIRGSLWFVSN